MPLPCIFGRPGNLHDLARSLFAGIADRLPGVETELIDISQHRVEPCNGCAYECLLGAAPGQFCPQDDDLLALWRTALSSDCLIYFLPTYGGLPPATWVAFQQRFHGLFRRPEAAPRPESMVAVLSLYDPMGVQNGDISQQIILHRLAGGGRRLVHFEQLIAANYGLNGLRDRLVEHEGIRARVGAMAERIAQELTARAGE
ncbi:MAG TPA: hypothetical protein VNT75_24315 [Symbiobacteriaceae bacterium]|nr:hypothetical protein [Symbiobacteriaceae bacterium]